MAGVSTTCWDPFQTTRDQTTLARCVQIRLSRLDDRLERPLVERKVVDERVNVGALLCKALENFCSNTFHIIALNVCYHVRIHLGGPPTFYRLQLN